MVLRRSGVMKKQDCENAGEAGDVLCCGDLRMYTEENRVEYKGSNIALTWKEYELFHLFLEQPTKTFTKANLYESVWKETYYFEDNTINVHLSNLRNKLKKATGRDYIDTVWGVGYRLKGEQENGSGSL